MSDRSRRWRVVAASVAMASLMLAGCGSDSDEPNAEPSSLAPVVDADGYTPEERAAIERVEAVVDAIYGRGTTDIATSIEGLATKEYTDNLVKTTRPQVEDAGLKWLGPYSFEADTVTVEEGLAVVEGCLDAANVHLVPRGDDAIKPGAPGPGQIFPTRYELEKSGDTWLVRESGKAEVSC